ncbi:MAG: hypothetical protein IJ002_09285 [Clostridia bacterium]|nr:hypothetical protein [Clostridia bacterium]
MNENEIILTANCIKALAGKPDSDELIQHLLKQMCTPSNESYPQQSVFTITYSFYKPLCPIIDFCKNVT